jgi:hypothetical protein
VFSLGLFICPFFESNKKLPAGEKNEWQIEVNISAGCEERKGNQYESV